MKREELKTIIKIRSFWKIDRRKGNYRLPSGERLSSYVESLVKSQLALDGLGFQADGNITTLCGSVLMIPFKTNENTTEDEQRARLEKFVKELIG